MEAENETCPPRLEKKKEAERVPENTGRPIAQVRRLGLSWSPTPNELRDKLIVLRKTRRFVILIERPAQS